MPKRTVGVLLKNGFADATREEMEHAFHMKVGTSAAPSLSDDELRAALLSAYGSTKPPETPAEDPAPAVAATPIARIGKIPNLGPTGTWEGRKRRVTFHKRDGSPKQEVQPVGWDGLIWNIPLETTVDMPWPFWVAAQNTRLKDEGSEDVTEWHKTPDKRLEKHVTPKYHDTVRFTDHGDVPGTESLPCDYVEFFRAEARRTNAFAKFPRPALMLIYNRLHDPVSMEKFRDMRDEDIRIKIAVTLGEEFEQILTEELYAAAG